MKKYIKYILFLFIIFFSIFIIFNMTIYELFNLILTFIFLYLIFKDDLEEKDIYEEINIVPEKKSKIFNFNYELLFVLFVSIILHEFFHKLCAQMLGFHAEYHISLLGFILGYLFKYATGIIFFIPGYVVIEGHTPPLDAALIAIAGPFANILLLGLSKIMQNIDIENIKFWTLMYNINLVLAIINLIPLPPLDGFKFIYNLYLYYA